MRPAVIVSLSRYQLSTYKKYFIVIFVYEYSLPPDTSKNVPYVCKIYFHISLQDLKWR